MKSSPLIHQLQKKVPTGMQIPPALIGLYDWIEEKGYFVDHSENRTGFLFSPQKLKESWSDTGREGGTHIAFEAIGSEDLKYWFDRDDPEIHQRLCVFARSVEDGSQCALWLNEESETQIVHLGSGSLLTCVLAENGVDFLRLLAIGYEEICWNEAFANPPNTLNQDFIVHPNREFQAWVQTKYEVSIPETALEIVKHPVEMGDEDSEDAFCKWSDGMAEGG